MGRRTSICAGAFATSLILGACGGSEDAAPLSDASRSSLEDPGVAVSNDLSPPTSTVSAIAESLCPLTETLYEQLGYGSSDCQSGSTSLTLIGAENRNQIGAACYTRWNDQYPDFASSLDTAEDQRTAGGGRYLGFFSATPELELCVLDGGSYVGIDPEAAPVYADDLRQIAEVFESEAAAILGSRQDLARAQEIDENGSAEPVRIVEAALLSLAEDDVVGAELFEPQSLWGDTKSGTSWGGTPVKSCERGTRVEWSCEFVVGALLLSFTLDRVTTDGSLRIVGFDGFDANDFGVLDQ